MLILRCGGFGIAFPFGQRPLVPPNHKPNTQRNGDGFSNPPNLEPNIQRNGYDDIIRGTLRYYPAKNINTLLNKDYKIWFVCTFLLNNYYSNILNYDNKKFWQDIALVISIVFYVAFMYYGHNTMVLCC